MSVFIKELHNPDIINSINNDLQIDITNLTLQTQIHLLRFLWEQSIEKFEIFKQSLQNISNEEDKYNFLRDLCKIKLRLDTLII
jgi:hypothetical protein